MPKVSFIEACSPGAHIFSRFPIPRLGTVLLGTILKERGFAVKVFIEDVSYIDWGFIKSSDIVGISSITSTAPRAYLLADKVRSMGKKVILGGAHPTFMPEEALSHSDVVVRGEADHIIEPLVSYLLTKSPDIGSIKGISYKDPSGRIIHNPTSDFINDLDSLPTPDLTLVHNFKASNIYPISTSRGCPYDCKFCSVIQMFGRRYRYRSVEKTLRDIEIANSFNSGTKFFVDDNFTANKQRTKEILRGMLREGIKTHWSAQVRIDIAKDPELLRLMAESGCNTLYIGFESINPETLKLYNKKQSLEDIKYGIKKIQDFGIHIHGMFVLGADTDDIETIRNTASFASRLGIDTIQFMILTPLPGTPFYTEMVQSERLIHRDWSKYDAHHVVFKPLRLTPLELQIETIKAMSRFYSWKYIIKNLLRLKWFYAGVGVYGKNTIKTALKEIRQYIKEYHIKDIEFNK